MRTRTGLTIATLLTLAANLGACGTIKAAIFPPTETPTPTPTPTPRPTATVTPTPTPTPLPDISRVLLKLDDLPSNFIEAPPSQVAMMTLGMEGFGFSESVAAVFTDLESGETVSVITGLLLDDRAASQFQDFLGLPDLVLIGVLSAMGTNPVVRPGQLPGVNTLGDQASAVTGTVDVQGAPVQVDSVLAKRGAVGMWVFSLVPDGIGTTPPIIDLAKLVDGRIITLMGSPPGIRTGEGPELEMPAISGLSAWVHDADSGGYEYFYATAEDTYEDVRDCVRDEMLNNGLDLQGVQATISTQGHGWETLFTFFMADLHPGASTEWVVEIQNSLGLLMLNDASELDAGGLAPPPTLQSVSTFSESGYDLKVIDLNIPTLYPSAVAAAEGLQPWFTELRLSVRAETPSGAACDEFKPAG